MFWQVLPPHCDVAYGADGLLPLDPLGQTEVLCLLQPPDSLLVVRGGGWWGGQEGVGEGVQQSLGHVVEVGLDEGVCHAGVGPGEPGLLEQGQHGRMLGELVGQRGQAGNHGDCSARRSGTH